MNLNQVTAPTRDMATAINFYELLGLNLFVDSAPRYARFECPVGDATFSLHYREEVNSEYGITIYFELESAADLDQKVKEMSKAGIEFEVMPTDQSWLWREARLLDPDGNRIILYYAGENRKNPLWRID